MSLETSTGGASGRGLRWDTDRCACDDWQAASPRAINVPPGDTADTGLTMSLVLNTLLDSVESRPISRRCDVTVLVLSPADRHTQTPQH